MDTPTTTARTITADASLRVDFSAEDGMLQLHSVMPDGIVIGHGPYGRCLVATKAFAKGSILYRGYAALVADNDLVGSRNSSDIVMEETGCNTNGKDEKNETCDEELISLTASTSLSSEDTTNRQFRLRVYDANNTLPLETVVLDNNNSVWDIGADDIDKSRQRRQYYGFDGFMNHSCNANTYSGGKLAHRFKDWLVYDTLAMQDIREGDEITCDYALFDYTCHGHEIEACGCKADNCRGAMLGFRGLPLHQQVAVMHLCDRELVTKFMDEHKQRLVHLQIQGEQLPPGVALVQNNNIGNNWHLVATKTFQPDQPILCNQKFLANIPREEFEQHDNIFLLQIDAGEQYLLLDPKRHLMQCPTRVKALGFETLMIMAAADSTDQQFHPSNTYRRHDDNDKNDHQDTYTIFAATNIAPGDTFTGHFNNCNDDNNNS